jgi:hypothetical protein
VWAVIEAQVGSALPPNTARALGNFTWRLAEAERLRLIDKALARAAEAPVHHSLYDAAHVSELPAQQFADRLMALFEAADDVAARRRVMELWRHLDPTSQSVRRRLVEAVYLPLASSGDEGLDLALSFFGLVAPVKGVRSAVRDALRNAAHSDEQKRRVDGRLLEAGWTRKSLFGLLPPRDEG